MAVSILYPQGKMPLDGDEGNIWSERPRCAVFYFFT